MAEQVTLDGNGATLPWPVDLAMSLLQDPAPWGSWWPGHPDNQRPNRQVDFIRLAMYVTAYHRHPFGQSWSNPARDDELSQTCARYATQDLLDALFHTARTDRFNYGLICRLEPRLRLILQEVVHRVQSEDPPQFVLIPAPTGNP